MKPSLQKAALTTLRADFVAAINPSCGKASLDDSMAALKARISSASFAEHLSVYSMSQIRRILHSLSRINTTGLAQNPLEVAVAVSSVLKGINDLGFTMRQIEVAKVRT